jgi:hypothetical protein
MYLDALAAFVVITVKSITPLKLLLKSGLYTNLGSGLADPRYGEKTQPTLQYILTGQKERFGHVSFTC